MRERSRWANMRLQTRLALAFAAVAAVPLLTVPLVLRSVNGSFDRAYARELDGAAKVVEAELDRLGAEVESRTRAQAGGRLADEVARSLTDGDTASLVAESRGLLADSGLDVLEVIDRDGTILFSGQVPARLGDEDAAALALARSNPSKAVLETVEVERGGEIGQALALVRVAPVARRPGAFVLGGMLVGSAELERLSSLVRGEVTLLPDEGARETRRRRVLPPVLGRVRALRRIEVPAETGERTFEIRLSDSTLVESKKHIAWGALVAFALALAVGGVLAATLARRTVSPVEALLAATQELAKGDLSHRVEVRAPAELGQLVAAFNEMTEKLARAQDRLAQAERTAAWEQIARALAHEIKNPLTPIAMAVETLQRTHDRQHPEFDRFFREGTQTVLEEVARLKRLASEFSELARWPKPVLSPATPAELIRSAAALYSSPPGGVALEPEIEPDLPGVRVDRDQVQRALVNLVKNAIEAMPDGGRIELRARRAQEGVALEVADHGRGLPLASRQKVFEPYYTTKVEGTGLGLAIVQRIATEHEGRVEVEETAGGGATFRLWLPALAETGTVAAA